MKKRDKLLLLLVPLLIVIWNSYFPAWMMTGTFVSNNAEPVLDGPNPKDTLVLFENHTFISGAWGKGEYKVTGYSIKFTYLYSIGTAGFNTHIDRPYFIGTPRIMLNTDLGYYYKKVN